MRVRLKPRECDAIQWTGDNLLEIAALLGEPHQYHREGPHLTILSPSGPETLEPGDWLIRSAEGHHFRCEGDVFPQVYEPVPETPVLHLIRG